MSQELTPELREVLGLPTEIEEESRRAEQNANGIDTQRSEWFVLQECWPPDRLWKDGGFLDPRKGMRPTRYDSADEARSAMGKLREMEDGPAGVGAIYRMAKRAEEITILHDEPPSCQ